ncbi:Rv3654c family TadE-like protein [Streptomyces sp. VB1]|uniref:Rv3654c family TadE-like protein n=1 Tax=Streptomyces sp. VB1 TaxID=2986803 RepID=UPI002ADE21B7|nr:Rv3654c family TadE-like protein [Streptomyces sp. VB1]
MNWRMGRGADRGAGRRMDRVATWLGAWIAARLVARLGAWLGARIARRIANRRAGLGADRGVATVWVAVTAAGLCTVFAVVLALGQAVAARHRAGGAADLAALAAADRALEGTVAACATARRVALAQGAVLVRCAVRGEIADVTARSEFGPYLPAVRAQAGPPVDPGAPADSRAIQVRSVPEARP